MHALEPEDGENYVQRAEESLGVFRREIEEAEEMAQVENDLKKSEPSIMRNYADVDDKTRRAMDAAAAAQEAMGKAAAVDAHLAQEKKKPAPELRYKLQLITAQMNNVQLSLQNLQLQVNIQVGQQNALQAEMTAMRMHILQEHGVDIATHYLNENNEFVPNPTQAG